MLHQDWDALEASQLVHTVQAGKDKLGLGIDTSQVAVGIACTVTDNPLRLFAGQSLLAGMQHLARQVVDLLLNIHRHTAHVVHDVAHTGKVDGRIVVDVQLPVIAQVVGQRLDAGLAVLGMSVDGVDFCSRKLRADKGIPRDTQYIDLPAAGVKLGVHNDVGQLLGVVHSAAQHRDDVLFQRLDVVALSRFGLPVLLGLGGFCQHGPAFCSPLIANRIGNDNSGNQTRCGNNNGSDFFR